MVTSLSKLISPKPASEPEIPPYVNFNEPLGVLKRFADHDKTLEAHLVLKGLSAGVMGKTFEGFVQDAKTEEKLFILAAPEGKNQVISDGAGNPVLRVSISDPDDASRSDIQAFSLPEEPDDNPVLLIKPVGRGIVAPDSVIGKFRNSASGTGGLETSEALEIGCMTKGSSNSFKGIIEVEIQKKTVAVVSYFQDIVKHPFYNLKIDPNIDTSLIVVCILAYHRMAVDSRGSLVANASECLIS